MIATGTCSAKTLETIIKGKRFCRLTDILIHAATREVAARTIEEKPIVIGDEEDVASFSVSDGVFPTPI